VPGLEADPASERDRHCAARAKVGARKREFPMSTGESRTASGDSRRAREGDFVRMGAARPRSASSQLDRSAPALKHGLAAEDDAGSTDEETLSRAA